MLESLGRNLKNENAIVDGLRTLLETYLRIGEEIDLDEQEYLSVLQRVQADTRKAPQIRGSCCGSLWSLSRSSTEQILALLMQFNIVQELGDFLVGLFSLAREVAQRDPGLIASLDRTLLTFGADEFHNALPSLRLAFTRFTPREKNLMLTNLFRSLNVDNLKPLETVSVDPDVARESLATEERMFETLSKFGLEQTDDWF